MHTTTRRRTAALVLGLALLPAGCGAGSPATGGTTTGPTASEPVATTVPAPSDPEPTHEPTDESELDLLRGVLPSDTELDAAVGDALDAYLAHRTLYDAAVQAGFADEEQVDDLLATTSGGLREAIREVIAQLDGDTRAIDGSSEVLTIEASWLHFPAARLDTPDVTFDTCLELTGGPEPEDHGTTEQLAVTVRMAKEEGRWVVWSQRDYGTDCAGLP